ncbi:MAG: hypothetical protein D0433_02745 [Candidatus Thermochlorobacter aerophilum]|uniref:Uncharacterized protein n=1 Tax=Candidatus Thermochlorobacter aerophilus TaxID=1868324 RepID=A0A395M497_9BACT|nr:MAG: hypothetical protein D0433_02745 [Candidatus Thermochlorobacter aerophilum]
MTKKDGFGMTAQLNEVKHPTGFLGVRNDKKEMLGMTKDECGTVQQHIHIWSTPPKHSHNMHWVSLCSRGFIDFLL